MGNAKRRGTYTERVDQALAAGRVKRQVVMAAGGPLTDKGFQRLFALFAAQKFPMTPTRRQRRRTSKRLCAKRRRALGVLA